VAAIEPEDASGSPNANLGSIALAALALHSLLSSTSAHGETIADSPQLAFKIAHYQDRQPGLDRIRVTSPAIALYLPIASDWSLDLTTSYDGVSGASPRWHSAISGASGMTDHRTAGSARLGYRSQHWSATLSAAHSHERDYRSQAASVEFKFESSDRNRSWTVGIGASRDHIHPVNGVVTNERRRLEEVLLGVTQNLSADAVVQLSYRRSQQRGYLDDPYKIIDRRPRARDQDLWVLRWNHYLSDTSGVLRSYYRYYRDSFRIRAHTVQVEWVKPLSERWSITPGLRYHSQSAAYFYYDPVYHPQIGEPFPIDWPRALLSPDHRLSAFGALTFSLRADYVLNSRWSLDARVDYYEQRASWRAGGGGSPGLAHLSATQWMLGVKHRF
jgi:hypothetical protein